MDTHPFCPACGTALGGSNVPEGLCPPCLLKAALGEPEPAPPLEAVPAGKVFGDYQIRGPLGQGGMGVVYAARQISLNRPVALKMVRSPHLASESDLARFRQEAEAAARLDHPNIVPVYEAGERDGVQYFTMKLVDGARSIASDLAKSPMEPAAAARLMSKIARAVHYAHQRGVIHRDIKPANILMDSSGEPQLTDFGLAKLQETTISLTQADRVIGTPQYMSPEQVNGHSRELTTATDIYSLGAVFYEMLTGRPPFHSNSLHEILRLVAEKEPKPPRSLDPSIDRDLQTVCLKCLEKNPARRYASADDLANDLECWLGVRPITARPVTALERCNKWGRRNPVVAGLGGALLIVGLVAIGLYINEEKNRKEYGRKERERLRESLNRALTGFVSEASAKRSSGKEGRRWEGIASIVNALKIMTSPELPEEAGASVMPELRNEAIACLSIVDFRPMEAWSPRGDAAVSPEFTRYAETLPDGRIAVRSFPQHQDVASWSVEGGVSGGLRFSANGRKLAALHKPEGGAVRLAVWEVAGAGPPVLDRAVPADSVFELSPDGGRLALFAGAEIQVVEIETASVLKRIASESRPDRLRFSPDGRRIAVLRKNDRLRLIDAEAGDTVAECGVGQARSVAWDTKGRWLAIGGVGQIFVWDTLHPADAVQELPAQSGEIEQVAWHPNGRLLASESDGLVVIWNVRTGMEEVRSSVRSQNGLQFSPDGSRLGLLWLGPNVGVFEVEPGFGRQAVGHPRQPISGADWSPVDGGLLEAAAGGAVPPGDGRVLVTAADDAVRFWNREGESVGTIRIAGALSVLWGKHYLFATGRCGIMRWPVIKADDGTSPQISLGRREVIDSGTGWQRAAMSVPDAKGGNRWIAVTGPDRVLVMSPDVGKPAVKLKEEHGAAFAAISRDNRWLAAGSPDGKGVHVWSLPDGEHVAHIPVLGSANVGFTIDDAAGDHSDWLVIGSNDRYSFWRNGDWKAAEHLIETKLGITYPGAMAFSSRGTALALESKHNQITIIYPHPPSYQAWAKPDFARQSPLAFSPKGGLLVDADEKRHIIIWNLCRLRDELKPLGLDWPLKPLIDPDGPPVERVTVEGEP
jgi:eukaryotic-like serine/threonine-protein kinase